MAIIQYVERYWPLFKYSIRHEMTPTITKQAQSERAPPKWMQHVVVDPSENVIQFDFTIYLLSNDVAYTGVYYIFIIGRFVHNSGTDWLNLCKRTKRQTISVFRFKHRKWYRIDCFGRKFHFLWFFGFSKKRQGRT